MDCPPVTLELVFEFCNITDWPSIRLTCRYWCKALMGNIRNWIRQNNKELANAFVHPIVHQFWPKYTIRPADLIIAVSMNHAIVAPEYHPNWVKLDRSIAGGAADSAVFYHFDRPIFRPNLRLMLREWFRQKPFDGELMGLNWSAEEMEKIAIPYQAVWTEFLWGMDTALIMIDEIIAMVSRSDHPQVLNGDFLVGVLKAEPYDGIWDDDTVRKNSLCDGETLEYLFADIGTHYIPRAVCSAMYSNYAALQKRITTGRYPFLTAYPHDHMRYSAHTDELVAAIISLTCTDKMPVDDYTWPCRDGIHDPDLVRVIPDIEFRHPTTAAFVKAKLLGLEALLPGPDEVKISAVANAE